MVRRIQHSKHVEHCYVVLALVRLFETRVAHVSQGDFKPRTNIGPRESAAQLFGEIQMGAVQVIRLGLVSAAQAEEGFGLDLRMNVQRRDISKVQLGLASDTVLSICSVTNLMAPSSKRSSLQVHVNAPI